MAGLSICVCVFEHAWEAFSVEETNEREFTGGKMRIGYVDDPYFNDIKTVIVLHRAALKVMGQTARVRWPTIQSDDCLISERSQERERHVDGKKGGILIGLQPG